MNRSWIIQNHDTTDEQNFGCYWSNEDGWIEVPTFAEHFNNPGEVNLPIGGVWVVHTTPDLSDFGLDDYIQHGKLDYKEARILACMYAHAIGDFNFWDVLESGMREIITMLATAFPDYTIVTDSKRKLLWFEKDKPASDTPELGPNIPGPSLN